MNVLFHETMTVYNYYRDPDTGEESWRRAVIRGIQWRHGKKELSVSKNQQTENRMESITVDFSHTYGRPEYADPVRYDSMLQSERESCWTLNEKCGLDVIVLGETAEEIFGEADIDRLRERYPYVVMISAVTDNRNRPMLKHIRVVGK